VLARINRKARIIICGAISQYNNTTPVQGPKNYLSLLVNRARMEGIVVFDYADRYHLAVAEMAGYLKDGRMKSKEDVVPMRPSITRTTPDTIDHLAQQAPDALAVIDEDRPISRARLRRELDCMAAALHSLGVAQGTHVALACEHGWTRAAKTGPRCTSAPGCCSAPSARRPWPAATS
jgi:hypothetical protein